MVRHTGGYPHTQDALCHQRSRSAHGWFLKGEAFDVLGGTDGADGTQRKTPPLSR